MTTPETAREIAERIVVYFIRGYHPLETHAEMVDAIAAAIEAERTRHAEEMREARKVIEQARTAWDTLSEGSHPPHNVEAWLRQDMAPAINDLRAYLASHPADSKERT